VFAAVATASTASAIGVAPVGHGFTGALYVAQAPGEQRLLVVTQAGIIRPITAAGAPGRPWLDIRDRVGSTGIEQGLLGLAFAPDFVRSGRFYVNYTNTRGDTRVVEFRSRPNAARVNTRTARLVLSQPQPTPNHNGGNLQFGPDGMLYVGLGDGGPHKDPENNGQNLGTWLAKILRIDVNPSQPDRGYSIPKDNPFITPASQMKLFDRAGANVGLAATNRGVNQDALLSGAADVLLGAPTQNMRVQIRKQPVKMICDCSPQTSACWMRSIQ
jgi:glucose/arabinose dehydrogenase